MLTTNHTTSATRNVLQVGYLSTRFYHLMGYTPSKQSLRMDEIRRVDAAIQMIREWGLRKEWGEREGGMESVLCNFVRGG